MFSCLMIFQHLGIKTGSINSIDKSSRSKLSYTELLKQAETNTAPIPDKAVQFV